MGRHQAISLSSSSAKAYSWEGGESKSMSTPTWEFQYSIEADAHPEFAWEFWTNIANWRELEPGVEFELDGPFAAGARGRTRMPGQEPRHWLIRAVDPGRSWIQEMSLPGALFIVSMHFEKVVKGRTRITQRLWLEGEGAEALLDDVRIFETTTPDGLKRIAAVIERARRKASDSEH
jgi:Polyketide cyclase / dehydrase and lipid transport